MSSTSDTAPTRTVAPPAGLARRWGAMLYDLLLLVAVWMSTLLLAILANGGAAVGGPGIQLLLAGEWVVYYLYCWRRSGQTLGMRAWRLQLVDERGGPASLRACLIRLLAAPLSLLPAAAGYLWYYVGQRQQTWHDRLSATYVVLLPRQEVSQARTGAPRRRK